MSTNAIHHDAHAVNQVIELLRHQAELFEHFRQLENLFLRCGVATTFRFDGIAGQFVLRAQLGEFLARQLRIDAVVIIAAVVVFFFIFVFVVIHLFLREFRTDVRRRWRHVFFGVRVNKTGDQIGQTRLFRLNAIVLLQQIGDGFRVFSNRALHLVNTVFDTFSDVDFAFARQQLDGTHFTHVHAHRVGCASDFRLNAGENLRRSFFRIFVSIVVSFSKQKIIGIRCFFHHLNAHVVDHLDDVFDLIGVDDIFRQMVIDLGIGQIACGFCSIRRYPHLIRLIGVSR